MPTTFVSQSLHDETFQTHTPQIATKTILVIDDSQLICELVADALTQAGYSTMTAYNRTALSLGKLRVPDLILLDLNLADTDGGELSRLFKSHPRTSFVPIVIMTGSTINETCALGVQADGYLPKPFSTTELMATVKWYIGRGSN